MAVQRSTSTPARLRRRGRPRKFPGPSRHVALTLPEETIAALGTVDADLGRAIVRLAQPVRRSPARLPAELAHFRQRAVITVTPTRTLEQRAGVELVPLPDGRALISFDRARTSADLELAISDALDDPALPGPDRQVFGAIARILKDARRSQDIVLRQRNILVLEPKRARRREPLPARASVRRAARR